MAFRLTTRDTRKCGDILLLHVVGFTACDTVLSTGAEFVFATLALVNFEGARGGTTEVLLTCVMSNRCFPANAKWSEYEMYEHMTRITVVTCVGETVF